MLDRFDLPKQPDGLEVRTPEEALLQTFAANPQLGALADLAFTPEEAAEMKGLLVDRLGPGRFDPEAVIALLEKKPALRRFFHLYSGSPEGGNTVKEHAAIVGYYYRESFAPELTARLEQLSERLPADVDLESIFLLGLVLHDAGKGVTFGNEMHVRKQSDTNGVVMRAVMAALGFDSAARDWAEAIFDQDILGKLLYDPSVSVEDAARELEARAETFGVDVAALYVLIKAFFSADVASYTRKTVDGTPADEWMAETFKSHDVDWHRAPAGAHEEALEALEASLGLTPR